MTARQAPPIPVVPAFPIRYIDPVHRPPSEADSLILPVTDGLRLARTVFRSDHASNWLVLKGTLGTDRDGGELRAAIAHPETAPLRPASTRVGEGPVNTVAR